jgi:hypothetical protein
VPSFLTTWCGGAIVIENNQPKATVKIVSQT